MGKLVDMMKKRHLVILEKPSGAIAIVGDMNALQRKMYDVFLFEAKDELKKDSSKDYFKISLSEIIGALELEKPNKQRLKQMIRDLIDIKIEYNYLRKDGETWGISSVLNDIKVDFDKEIGKTVINYSLPRIVRDAMVKKNGVFAKIDLVVVKGLKSKYAILLYELIKDYEKVEVPRMTVKDFRKMFGVENKYPRMPDLRKYVLDPACKEISENPHTDFMVSYELKKEGKAYTQIKFHVKPKPAELKDNIIGDKKVLEAEVKENSEVKDLLALIPSEHRRKTKVVSLVLGSVETKGKEYTKAQIEYVNEKYKSGKIKNYVAYLKNAIEKDYAGFEEVDDIGFVTPDDAIGYRGYITHEGKERYVEIAYIRIEEPEAQGIGYDRERKYLVRLDDAETGELVTWRRVNEKKLLEFARKNIELRKKRRES